jgi:cellulose synthase/poly-beta-1,6-N-acetylglucosamine synthase-like glycosyltransferase
MATIGQGGLDVRSRGSLLGKRDTAERTLTRSQVLAVIVLVMGLAVAIWLGWLGFLIGGIGTMIMIYIIVLCYKSWAVYYSLKAGVILITDDEVRELKDEELPQYSVLVPLYKEAEMISILIGRLLRLDYPWNKLQILLLIEADDYDTIQTVNAIELPSHFEIIEILPSEPRTKPKACNIGLAKARGEYCVVYDAEDRPERDQLRKAVAAFGKSGDEVACIQAKLQFWNPDTNLLTRFFAAEYITYFNLVMPGYAALGLPVPLAGTSNHLRLNALRQLGGWDAFNVTEDLDLGMWLARHRLQVRMISSVTWEEANSRLGSWLRQRSRWIKGHMQTYLVHMRSPRRLLKDLGVLNFLSFQLIVGGTPLVLLVNPIFWASTVVYAIGGQSWIESLYPRPILYLGVVSMVFGNFILVYYVMTGCIIDGQYRNVKLMILSPFYWVFMSVAAWRALFQLMLKPHHWEKTAHGLVLTEEAYEEITRIPVDRRDNN